MSIDSIVTNYVKFSGDEENELIYSSGELTNSPASQVLVSLSSGNNTILVPDVDGFTVHGVAIVPPAANTVEPILKGVSGDTGITLAANQVSVVPFGTEPPASFVLNVSEDVPGFKLIWF